MSKLLAGAIMVGFIAGICFVGADSFSSVVTCDGATWTSSSIVAAGQVYAAKLFTTDLAVLLRELQIGNKSIQTATSVNSTGPMGIDEYSSQHSVENQTSPYCVFETVENTSPREDKIRYTGLMQTGQYVSSRAINQETSAVTMINGTGMILGRSQSKDANKSQQYSTDVAGNMSMTEKIVFGGE